MNEDLFNMLDRAGFGENVHEVAAEGECRVLRLDDSSGEGFMTMYRVFDGVYLMFNDFHLESCLSQYQNAETLISIDHCREGRIEHINQFGGRYYMEAGDIRIDRRVHHAGSIHFPLNHYHGMTIGFMKGIAEHSLAEAMPCLKTDLAALADKFCPDNKEFLLRDDERLNLLFSQLYRVPKLIRTDLYKLKIMELLILLDTVEPAAQTEERQYFPAAQTDKVKEIRALMISDLSQNYTVEELSAKFGIPAGTLRKVFRAVYGSPLYRYMRSYRMNYAAQLLVSQRDMRIADIAQQVGYDNASKFSAAFRDVMGTTPQEYRSR